MIGYVRDKAQRYVRFLAPMQPSNDVSAVEVVSVTPCPSCLREARYTVQHVATAELATRATGRLRHDELHELVYVLEHASLQVPVGRCECGAPGAETGSVILAHRSRREPTGWIADDLSYQIVSVGLVDDGYRADFHPAW